MNKAHYETMSKEALIKLLLIADEKEKEFVKLLKGDCENCMYANSTQKENIYVCGRAKCEDINDLGQYVVTGSFGCNEWEAKQ